METRPQTASAKKIRMPKLVPINGSTYKKIRKVGTGGPMNLKGRQGVSDLNYLFKPHPSRICIDIKLEKCNIHEYFHGIIWMFTGWKVPQIFHYLKYISNFPNRLRLHSQKCKVLKTKCLSLVFPFLKQFSSGC